MPALLLKILQALQIFSQFSALIGIASSLLMILGRCLYWLFTRKRSKIIYKSTVNGSIFHPSWKLSSQMRASVVGQQNVQVLASYNNGAPNNTVVNLPGFVELEIRNTGNVTLQQFNGPTQISFGTNTLILQAEVIKNSCPFGQLLLDPNGYQVTLHPQTMNVKDFLKIQFLLERRKNTTLNADMDEPLVSCHITNVQAGIVRYDAKKQRRRDLLLFYATCLLCLLAFLFLLFANSLFAFISCAFWLALSLLFLIGRFVDNKEDGSF